MSVYALRPYVLGGTLAYAVYWGALWLAGRLSGGERRLAQFAGLQQEQETLDFGSQQYRVRFAFARYGIRVDGRERLALWLARAGMGLVMFLGLKLVGLPGFSAYSGFISGVLVANGIITARWVEMKSEIEREIPAFLQRLSTVIQAKENISVAIEEVSRGLNPQKPLKGWMEQLLSRLQQSGRVALEELAPEALVISPALGIVVFLIGRAWDTGGQGYARALALSSESLEQALSGRLVGMAKAGGMRGAVNIILGITILTTAFLIHNPDFELAMRSPLVQTGYSVIALVMTFGYQLINQMIEDLLR